MKAFTGFTFAEAVAMDRYSAREEYAGIRKFGQNPAISTTVEDVWDYGGTITLFTSAVVIGVSSGSTDDASGGTGARTVLMMGLDANYDLQYETVTLNGQTKVETENAYLRVFRARVTTAGSGGENAGTIYFYDTSDTVISGVPQTAAKVAAAMTIGKNQTLMAVFTIPRNFEGWLYHHYVDYGSQTARLMELGELLVRPFGEVFQVKHTLGNNRSDHEWEFPKLLTPKTDIKIRVALSGAGIVDAGFDIILKYIGEDTDGEIVTVATV
jgi:hypothetical protein